MSNVALPYGYAESDVRRAGHVASSSVPFADGLSMILRPELVWVAASHVVILDSAQDVISVCGEPKANPGLDFALWDAEENPLSTVSARMFAELNRPLWDDPEEDAAWADL